MGWACSGWGVGGIEAEARCSASRFPCSCGSHRLQASPAGSRKAWTATDLVLTVVQMLRKKGGRLQVRRILRLLGLDNMTLADRATIGNMGPRNTAPPALLPVDAETINYLTSSGRERAGIALVEAYSKGPRHVAEGDGSELVLPTRWNSTSARRAVDGRPPSAPRRIGASRTSPPASARALDNDTIKPGQLANRYAVEGTDYDLGHATSRIAAITSCTNTSTPRC